MGVFLCIVPAYIKTNKKSCTNKLVFYKIKMVKVIFLKFKILKEHNMQAIFIAISIYFLSGIIQFIIPDKHKTNFLLFCNTIATIILCKPLFLVLFQNYNFNLMTKSNPILGDLIFKLDGLSAFFGIIIGIICLIGTYYAKGYLAHYNKPISTHLFLFNLFISSMFFVILSQNIIFFLISWEIMSLSSFLLLIFEHEKKEVKNIAINYLINMHICVLFLIVGFLLLNLKIGSLNIATFKNEISDFIFLLLFIGFGIKAGIVPMHTWLPKAHPVAPTHISALMSGVMIKTGIYGILRILTLYTPSIKMGYLVLAIGLLSAFFGILYSIAQRNYKKMLAYSSVENIGIICTAMGVGMIGMYYSNPTMTMLGLGGCLLHILNHSLFKTLLFMAVGAVYTKVHTKDMEKLGGLIKKMPKTAILFLIGSIAISALPPMNGFISEFLIYLGFLESFNIKNDILTPVMILSMAVLAFVGAMALISFSNAFSMIFLGNPKSQTASEVETDANNMMLCPMLCLVVLMLIIGLFPQYSAPIILAPLNKFVVTTIPTNLLNIVSLTNIGLISLFGVIFRLRHLLLKNKTISKNETWGCGYTNPSSKMQYSANSFTRPFLGFLTPFYLRELEFQQIKELFPSKTFFRSTIKDIFNVYFIEPIINICNYIAKRFYWIQSGNTQRYLLYGVIFLIITISCLLGGKL